MEKYGTNAIKVQKVYEEKRNVYEKKDGTLTINHMGGTKQVYRNGQGNVICFHAWKKGRALSIHDLMAEMKAKHEELLKNPPTQEQIEADEQAINELMKDLPNLMRLSIGRR